MCNPRNNERGQALVEFAVVFPIFIMILFFIIDCAWVGLQSTSFDYAYREASWEVGIRYDHDSEEIRDDYWVGHNIKKQIIDRAPMIVENNLEVMNARYYLWTEQKALYFPNVQGKTDRRVVKSHYVRIDAQLGYDVHPITPVGQVFLGENIHFTKNLAKQRLLTQSH